MTYEGHIIKLSRATDQTLSLKQRTDLANQWEADYLISIHVNAGGGMGFESFTYNGEYARKAITNQLRAYIHNEIIEQTGFRDRGKKEANFQMLRESLISALLTESGFIDNYKDAKKLRSEAFLNKVSLGHARGLAKGLELESKNDQRNEADHFHMIKKGDTLWALAQKYKTSVSRLQRLNAGIKPKSLQIGEKVRVR